MKIFIILLFYITLITIVAGYILKKGRCPAPVVEYRYVPRTFEEDQNDPVSLTDLFSSMFLRSTPWVENRLLTGVARRNNVNNSFFNTEQRQQLNSFPQNI